jgi:hypothetical protein
VKLARQGGRPEADNPRSVGWGVSTLAPRG